MAAADMPDEDRNKPAPKISVRNLFFDTKSTTQENPAGTDGSEAVFAEKADAAPVKPRAEAQAKAATQAPAKPHAEAEAKAATPASAKPKAAATAPAKPHTEAGTQAAAAKPRAETQAKAAAPAPAKPRADAPANSAAEAPEPTKTEIPREAKDPRVEQRLRQTELLSHMVSKLGERLVKYIMAVPDEEPLPETLTKKQERGAVRMLNMIVEGNDFSPDFELSVSVLSGHVKVLKTSMINSYRMYCGGDVPQVPRGDDRAVQSLRRLARDLWPLFLLPPDGTSTFPKTFQHRNYPIPVDTHPSIQAARTALTHDETISKLFPKKIVEELQGAAAQKPSARMENIGTLGVLYLDSVILSCIRNACYRAMLLHGGVYHDLIMKYVEQSVADLRTLIKSGVAEAPVIVGLSGVSLPAGSLIELDKGVIRNPHDVELAYFFDNRDKPSAVYQTMYEHTFFNAAQGEDFDDKRYREILENVADFSDFISGAAEEVNNVRFSILMASKPEPAQPYAVDETAILMLEPTLGTPAYYSFQNALSGECRISKADVKGVETWYRRIVKKHNNSLEIAKRRLLIAASPSRTSEDALIEALIVWENLFGAPTKTVQRITASIAALLEPNAAAKADLQKKLHHIYSQRNKIVYGTAALPREKVKILGSDAVQYTIRSMQTLYMKKTSLLSLSAEDRSSALL
jgi:hypothetical protein